MTPVLTVVKDPMPLIPIMKGPFLGFGHYVVDTSHRGVNIIKFLSSSFFHEKCVQMDLSTRVIIFFKRVLAHVCTLSLPMAIFDCLKPPLIQIFFSMENSKYKKANIRYEEL